MAQPQLVSGARGLIQLFNPTNQQFETIAFSTDINVDVRVGVQQTFVMGRTNAGAIDTLAYDVTVSVGRVIPVNSPGSLDPRTKGATAISAGLETVIAQMVSAEDLSIALLDRVTNKYIVSVKGCRFSGRTMRMSSNQVATETLNFTGIYDSGVDGENTSEDQGYES
jgi:hypothetical protein